MSRPVPPPKETSEERAQRIRLEIAIVRALEIIWSSKVRAVA
jgi:hypothetical protein